MKTRTSQYTTTKACNRPKYVQKQALTTIPRPLQQPPTGFLQRAPVMAPSPGYPTNPNQPNPSPNGQPSTVQQGRGRPVGSTTVAPNAANTANTAPPGQAGMAGQPSAVTSIIGNTTSTPKGKGFGNTPTHSSSSSSTKAATIMKTVNSAELSFMQKSALLGTLAGGGIGALPAPEGHKREGFHRGVGRTTGLGVGAGPGTLAGGGLGAGLGAGLGGLAGLLTNGSTRELVGLGALAGGGIGGLGGAVGGAVKGWNASGDYMGPASYDPNNKKPKKEEKKEKKSNYGLSVPTSVVDSLLSGGSMEAARAHSDRLPKEQISGRYGHGALRGLAGGVGSGLGTVLGALAGGGLGAITGAGVGSIHSNRLAQVLGTAGMLAGGGLGGAAGGYYGGKLGLKLTADSTDMARADKEKHEKDKLKKADFSRPVGSTPIRIPSAQSVGVPQPRAPIHIPKLGDIMGWTGKGPGAPTGVAPAMAKPELKLPGVITPPAEAKPAPTGL